MVREFYENDVIRLASRLREYAVFLEDQDDMGLEDKYEWSFPIFCTSNEILVHLQGILEEFKDGD